MKTFKIMRMLCLGMVISIAAVIAGCNESNSGNDNSSEPPKVQTETQKNPVEPEARKVDIMVYYADENATGLIGEKRTLNLKQGDDKYRLAVEELLKSPNTRGLVEVFPKNTKVKSVKVVNGTATVDFNKTLKNGFNGGSTGEKLLVNSLVNTLTDFQDIKKVKIQIEGKDIESLSGHMDLSEPLERSN